VSLLSEALLLVEVFLESEVPLLDRRVIEFNVSLDDRFLVNSQNVELSKGLKVAIEVEFSHSVLEGFWLNVEHLQGSVLEEVL